MIERIQFQGGLDSDTETRLLSEGNYKYALNIRNSVTDNRSVGAIENVKGNTLVEFDLPSGDNIVIGSEDDKITGSIYYFVWNSYSRHSIFEYKRQDGVIEKILQTPILNFKKDKLINDIDVVFKENGDRLLYWTDGDNPPRKTNIERARRTQELIDNTGSHAIFNDNIFVSGNKVGFDLFTPHSLSVGDKIFVDQFDGVHEEYDGIATVTATPSSFELHIDKEWQGSTPQNPGRIIPFDEKAYPIPFKEQYIDAVQYAPHFPPKPEYGTDTKIRVNNLRDNLFQFKYRYIYKDFEKSAWSPVSRVEIPKSEADIRPTFNFSVSKNNVLNIDVDIEHDDVEKIEVAARKNNDGDFFSLGTFDVIRKGNKIVNFYNSENYEFVDNSPNGSRLFDFLPKKANTQAIADENRIMYGGITENFDPVDVDVDVVPFTKSFLSDRGNPDISVGGNNPQGDNFYNEGELVDATGGLLRSSEILNGNEATGAAGDLIFTRKYAFQFKNLIPGDIVIFNLTSELSVTTGESLTSESEFRYLVKDGDTQKDIAKAFSDWLTSNEVLQENEDNDYDSNRSLVLENNTTEDCFGYAAINGIKKNTVSLDNDSINGVTLEDGNFSFEFLFGFIYTGSQAQSSAGCELNTFYTYNLDMSVTLIPDGGIERSFKAGSSHDFAIAYYDKANRSGLANDEPRMREVYVPYFTERPSFNGSTYMSFFINHIAPSWAKSWQLLYAGNNLAEKIPTSENGGYNGFVYGVTSGVSDNGDGTSWIDLSALKDYSENNPERINLTYSLSDGDRIRFMDKGTGDTFSDQDIIDGYFDTKIIDFDESDFRIKVKNIELPTSSGTIQDDMGFEIYTPNTTPQRRTYFEIGAAHPVSERGEHLISDDEIGRFSNRHQVLKTNINGEIFSDPGAKYTINYGDVYVRTRVSPYNRIVESYSFSDFYESDVWNKGRPNVKDDNIREIYRPDVVYYSNRYIDDTSINGLSEFFPDSFKQYNSQYGDIRKLYSQDKRLHIFQDLKVGQAGISEEVLYDNTGGTIGQVKRQDQVLSDIRYYKGEFGISNHPESFAEYGGRIYFADLNRGTVLRLARDGLTPISDYNMNNHFTELLKNIRESSDTWKLQATYDRRHEEYIISFVPVNEEHNFEHDTIAFSEPKNKWVTFYSFKPDDLVDSGTDIVSFKDGQLYTHNTNDTHGEFYGEKHSSIIEATSNQEPLNVKFYKNILVDSNISVAAPSITNSRGQKSNLVKDDFVNKEGVFKAPFLMDENTPNIDLPLLNGDQLRDQALDIRIEQDSDDFWRMISIATIFEMSELTNR